MSPEPVGAITIPEARPYAEGAPVGQVGILDAGGRPATAANIQAASKFWMQISPRDLAVAGEYYVDKATQKLFRPLIHDPLLSNPRDPRRGLPGARGPLHLRQRPGQAQVR